MFFIFKCQKYVFIVLIRKLILIMYGFDSEITLSFFKRPTSLKAKFTEHVEAPNICEGTTVAYSIWILGCMVSCLPMLLCRIGGAVPIVFSYFAEFLAREKRGEHLSWLCMFWMIGGIYASAMAWAIIPHYGE